MRLLLIVEILDPGLRNVLRQHRHVGRSEFVRLKHVGEFAQLPLRRLDEQHRIASTDRLQIRTSAGGRLLRRDVRRGEGFRSGTRAHRPFPVESPDDERLFIAFHPSNHLHFVGVQRVGNRVIVDHGAVGIGRREILIVTRAGEIDARRGRRASPKHQSVFVERHGCGVSRRVGIESKAPKGLRVGVRQGVNDVHRNGRR